MNENKASNLDQSASQICTSQRISDVKLSNNDIEDDEADSSQIISENFLEVLQKDFNNNDQTSATSSRNELNQKKKRVINLIYSPLNLKRIQSMKFISISLLCFLLLTVFLNYLAIKEDIDKCRQDTINIKTLGDVIYYESQSIQSKTFQQLDTRFRWTEKSFITQSDYLKIINDLYFSYKNYVENIQELNSLENKSEIQSIIQNTHTQILEFQLNNITTQFNKELSYDLLRRIQYLFQYKKMSLQPNEEYQININFLKLTDSFLSVLEEQYEKLEQYLNSTLYSLFLAFSLTITMSVLNVSILIPIHFIGINILNGQLKIFSHFTKEKLQATYTKIQKQLYLSVLQTKEFSHPKSANSKNTSHNISGQNIQWKKKGTSNTEGLKYITCRFLIFTIFLFILLTVYPIFNYVYGSKFIKELQNIIYKMKNMEQSRILVSINSGILNLKLYSKVQGYQDVDDYYVSIEFSQKINNYRNQISQNQTKYIEEMKKVDSYFNDETLIMYGDLKSAFLDPLQNNLCNILSSSFYSNITISQSECSKSFNAYIQKGLIFLLSDIQKKQEDILDQLQYVNNKQNLDDWNGQINFSEYFLYQRIINYIFMSISDRIQDSVKKMIDFVILLQYYMFFYAICQIILVQFIFQMRHFFKIQKQISKSKLIFSIFSVEFVLENNYFISYFKNKLHIKN